MPVQVASLFGTLSLDTSNWDQGKSKTEQGISGLKQNMLNLASEIGAVGGSLTTLFGPIAAGFGAGVAASLSFDEAVTNSAALLGYTRDQTELLKDQLRGIGGDTRAGPQATALAFYEIVSAVNDTSTHMAILDAAIHTAQAGQEDLVGTTNGLIGVMNSYGFAAEDAAMVSDVMTATVGKGKGSMGEFAAAFPQVTTLAHQLGVGFNDLGGMMAYVTVQGNTASTAATQLRGVMSAFIKPNQDMIAALDQLGYSSGQAAIDQLGLIGAVEAISDAAGADNLPALLGQVEAINGAMILTGEGADTFLTDFQTGIEGATAAMEETQMSTPQAALDLLNSKVSDLGIAVGDTLTPALADAAEALMPLVEDVITWVDENPELVAQIGQVATLGAGMGVALLGASLAMGAVATLVSPLGGLVLGLGILVALLNNPAIQSGLAEWPPALEAALLAASIIFDNWQRDLTIRLNDVKIEFLQVMADLATTMGTPDSEAAFQLGEAIQFREDMLNSDALASQLNAALAAGGPLALDMPVEMTFGSEQLVTTMDFAIRDAMENGTMSVVGQEAVRNFINAGLDQAIAGQDFTALQWYQTLASDMGMNMEEIGARVAEGMAVGVSDNASDATEAIETMGMDMRGALERHLGIESPSAVFMGYGLDTVAGLVIGLAVGIPGLAVPLAILNTTLAVGWATAATSVELQARRIKSTLGDLKNSFNEVASAANSARGAIGSFGGGSAPSHDYPGPATGGQAYSIGTPELFIAPESGYIMPIGGASVQPGPVFNGDFHFHQQPGQSGADMAEDFMDYIRSH